MDNIKVSIAEPMIRQIVSATYPEYRGRKIKIAPQTYPLNCKSYWEGGSRDFFRFLQLDTMQVAEMPAQSGFDKPINGADKVMLPVGIACVEHSIFCGKDVGITIHVNPANMTMMLPVEKIA